MKSLRFAENHPALPGRRHRELLRLLLVREQITIREVASQFNVSIDTARRDLDFLASEGLLSRTYGGAVTIQKSEGRQVDHPRQTDNHLYKERRLAQSLGRMIRDGETLFLNGGSTTRCCAEELGSRNLRMVTNNLAISFEFLTGVQFYLLGGKCQPDAQVTVGPLMVSGMSITVDSAVIGVDGITLKEGLTIKIPEEALMASGMIAAAQRTIVVADSSKFGKRSFAPIGPIESMHVLITDQEPPAELAQALDKAGVEVIIAMQEVAGSSEWRSRFTDHSHGVVPAFNPFQAANQPSNGQNTMLANGRHAARTE
jgi:DeoR family fructose operon transcriptional repressor